MDSDAAVLNRIIAERRSVFSKDYIQKAIPSAIINQVLENADRAPSHRLTEPWRFKVFRGESRAALGREMYDQYCAQTPIEEQSERKKDSFRNKPTQANVVIAICMQRDPDNRLPEWEELAAVAMAVQNIYLTCAAYKIGGYWSTPPLCAYLGEFLKLNEGEKCLGLFYMAHFETERAVSKRKPIEEKVVWM